MLTRNGSKERIGVLSIPVDKPAFGIFSDADAVVKAVKKKYKKPKSNVSKKMRSASTNTASAGAAAPRSRSSSSSSSSSSRRPLAASATAAGPAVAPAFAPAALDKENGSIFFASNTHHPPSSSSLGDSLKMTLKKTIFISSKEREMNGAPEGDLFDSTVMNDSDLHACANPEMEVARLVKSHGDSSLWADQFAAIEGFRYIRTRTRV
jgi:hypothetical protein